MPKCHFANFDITIRGSQPPYSVTAIYRNWAAEGEFHQDVTDNFWREGLLRLANTLVAPNAAAIEQVGGRLFDDLMQGDVRDLWVVARDDIEENEEKEPAQGLRIRLALRPPAVAALPWESLFDRDRNSAFAASGKTPVVRVENLLRHVGRPRSLAASLPIKILVAAPEDPTGVINASEEVGGVQALLAGLRPDKVQVSLLDGRFTITDLRRRLQEIKPDVLHLLTHGAQGGLLLWRRNQPVLASAAALRATLERSASVKFVFLNACLAGQNSAERLFSSVAAQLLQAGIPAVVAMQFEIRDDAAVEFAHFLYEELASEGCPGAIDAAVANARSSLYALYPGDFTYGTPVLWLNADDGQVFDLGMDGPDTATDTPRSSILLAERIDIAAEAEWLAQHMTLFGALRPPPDAAFVKIEWQHSVDALEDLLVQLRHLESNGSPEEYSAKARQYTGQKAEVLRLANSLREITR
jgi:hypothetical protein